MELLTYRLSDPNDKSKDLAKKITELVVASSVTIKEAMVFQPGEDRLTK